MEKPIKKVANILNITEVSTMVNNQSAGEGEGSYSYAFGAMQIIYKSLVFLAYIYISSLFYGSMWLNYRWNMVEHIWKYGYSHSHVEYIAPKNA